MADDPFEDFMGEEVVDAKGNTIGILACYWEHEQGKPVLLGVDVGELANMTHVLPAKGAHPDEEQAVVVVNYSREKVRMAPCLDCGNELDDEFENKVFAYYGENAFDYKIRTADAARRELRRKFRNASSGGKSSCSAPEPKTDKPV